MRTQAKQINIFERSMFATLVFVILILILLYGYFISKSIVNVVVREEISRDAIAIGSSISELEFKYIAHKNSINIEFAKSAGYKELANKSYVTRKSLATNWIILERGD